MLHAFKPSSGDGANPELGGARLIKKGLYLLGTTLDGGSGTNCISYSCGTVFELRK